MKKEKIVIKENPKVVSMQEQLVTLVKDMRKDGFDFKQAPVFEWRYEDIPDITFKLLVKEGVDDATSNSGE